ncbi:MAG: hypothetical protein COT74_10395 [Bdellovibrionales bacterium CG10_big_fil_rev_8_21_14_0_10_45_34]|nr:MAG: hypothetical protein COT74_10395 [Bdellovibrionales bacterium CG10_big_fil_rev_8_21_14_0_10_45_34]
MKLSFDETVYPMKKSARRKSTIRSPRISGPWVIRVVQHQKHLLALITLAVLNFGSPIAYSAETLKVCYVPWFGPDKEFGPDYEMAINFAKSNGYTTSFIQITYDQSFELESDTANETKLFRSGKCDLYSMALTLTPARKKVTEMIALYPGRSFVVVRKGTKDRSTLNDLKGTKTVVVKGTSYEQILENANQTFSSKDKIKIQTTIEGGNLPKLLSNEVDFIVMDSALAFSAIFKHSKELRLGFPVGKIEQLGWAVSKKNSRLANEIRSYFDSQKTLGDSEISGVFKKYFGLTYAQYERTLYSISK